MMNLANNLGISVVVVLFCNDKKFSSQERMEGVGENADMKEFFDVEQHLSYVSCTRAKDRLIVTCDEGYAYVSGRLGGLLKRRNCT